MLLIELIAKQRTSYKLSKVAVPEGSRKKVGNEDMDTAIWIVGVILCVFFVICSCQCYQKIAWECDPSDSWFKRKKNNASGVLDASKGHEPGEKRPMPVAPFSREGT